MYEYVDPKHLLDIPLGVWPLTHIESGVEKYADSRGVSLEAVWSSEEFNKINIIKYIREGFSSDSPIAMLYGFSNQKVKLHHPNPNLPEEQVYDKHWVTITQMTINESTGEVRLKTSSWGGYAEVYLDDFLENEIVYHGVLYFK